MTIKFTPIQTADSPPELADTILESEYHRISVTGPSGVTATTDDWLPTTVSTLFAATVLPLTVSADGFIETGTPNTGYCYKEDDPTSVVGQYQATEPATRVEIALKLGVDFNGPAIAAEVVAAAPSRLVTIGDVTAVDLDNCRKTENTTFAWSG